MARCDRVGEPGSVQTRMAWESGPCSAWDSRSSATNSGFGAGVGDHHDFGRSRRHIQRGAGGIGRDRGFCRRHPRIAGTEDLVDLWHGIGAVGHGRNGLRAADLEDSLHAAQPARRPPPPDRRGRPGAAGCTSRAPGNLQARGHREHDGRGGQRCAARRHIQPDGRDRPRIRSQITPGPFRPGSAAPAARVETLDIRDGPVNGFDRRRAKFARAAAASSALTCSDSSVAPSKSLASAAALRRHRAGRSR